MRWLFKINLSFLSMTIKKISFTVLVLLSLSFIIQSCNRKGKTNEKGVSILTMDSTYITPFFERYSDLKEYRKDYDEIYQYYDHHYIWFNEKGIMDYGGALYSKAKNIEEEGIYARFPYQNEIDEMHSSKIKNPEEHPDAELLMTGLYLFYMDNVYQGIGIENTKDLGWLLPRKDIDETEALKTLVGDKQLEKDDHLMFDQYYRLREVLKDYQEIKKNGGWTKINTDSKTIKPGEQTEAIRQIRKRLVITGEIEKDNGSDVYDNEIKEGLITFQKRNGFNRDSIINLEHIAALNISVDDYIKKIVVNMERCRWLPANFVTANEAILVNIPAYHMNYYEDGKITFDSDVIVGSQMHETVIFNGEMSYLAFSPYWNIPQSIVKNEIQPGIDREGDDYLKNRNMEWNDGRVRQLPGKNNSLGLVKFMFPNENNIYLHDTPAKSLFKNEDRARSHGCIRVAKARDLAIKILEDDEKWTVKKIDEAMNAGKESTYHLKDKIPVYIGYFTAWVDEDDTVRFYEDVYNRDGKLADLLLYKQ